MKILDTRLTKDPIWRLVHKSLEQSNNSIVVDPAYFQIFIVLRRPVIETVQESLLNLTYRSMGKGYLENLL